ncbi:replicase, partial [Bifidobacterium longum]
RAEERRARAESRAEERRARAESRAEEQRQREEIQRRVSEERKRHGGSMFAGSAGYVEGEPDETGAEDDVWHDPDEMTLF